MDITTKELTETSEVELTISATADDLSPFVREAAKNLSKERQIKGFRPGKAPVDVVAEVVGEDRLMHEALDRTVPQLFVQAVLENDIEAIDQPKVAVQELSREKGLTFTATVATLPEVTLGDLSMITVSKRSPEVDDEAVEQELKKLAQMRASFIDVARPAQEGDTVKVDFKIEVDGKALEGGEGKEQLVTLGEGHFIEDFEKNMVGIAAGDERVFQVTFPEDYGKKDLQGKEAQATVKAHAVQKQVLPELNDDFAKQVGKFESLGALKKQLKENMAHEMEHKEKDRFQGEMTAKLAEVATFGMIPEALVEKEIDRQLQEFARMLAMQQRTLEEYLHGRERTIDEVREEMREKARENVKVGLAMRAFVKQEDIEVEDSEIEEKMADYLKRFPTPEEAEKNVDQEELKEQLTSMLRNQKAMERLEEKVTVEPASPASDK